MADRETYARGGMITGHDGASDTFVPIVVSPCETTIDGDGTVRRNGVIVGRYDMDTMRAALDRIRQRQDERGIA